MAKGQMRGNKEKKKPKQDKNKKKGGAAPSPFAGVHSQADWNALRQEVVSSASARGSEHPPLRGGSTPRSPSTDYCSKAS